MISIVTTTRNSHQLNSWVTYHIKLGVDKIFIFVDDPNDKTTINVCRSFPNHVVFFVCTPSFIEQQRKVTNSSYFTSYSTETMSRQIINVEYILHYKDYYNITWLFHIDTDEVIHLKNRDKYVKNSLDYLESQEEYNIKLVNYELVPEHESYGNCFLEGTYFKTDGYRYIAYANGKSCVHVQRLSKCAPIGVHDFSTDQTQYTSPDIVVLHFVSCNFSQFLQKYYDLGNFGDKWWSNIPISISFHTQARDKVVKCSKSKEECRDEALQFYRQIRLLNNDTSDKIVKIDTVRQMLMD